MATILATSVSPACGTMALRHTAQRGENRLKMDYMKQRSTSISDQFNLLMVTIKAIWRSLGINSKWDSIKRFGAGWACKTLRMKSLTHGP